jgi:hypothetical protein
MNQLVVFKGIKLTANLSLSFNESLNKILINNDIVLKIASVVLITNLNIITKLINKLKLIIYLI